MNRDDAKLLPKKHWAEGSPIERLARVLCRADGNDPDGLLTRHAFQYGKGLLVNHTVYTEQHWTTGWHFYVTLAEVCLIHLGKLEK